MEDSAIESQLSDTTVKALLGELDTDWLPDPWNFADLATETGRPLRLSEDPSDLMSINVSLLGGRLRSVPILDPWTSALFHQAASAVLRLADGLLSSAVLAYRAIHGVGIEHYRSALLRRCEIEHSLAEERPVALVIDLESFFPSITLELLSQLLRDIPGWDRLQQILRAFTARYGYPLPEGYGAARSLANIALHPLDEVIPVPFTRWVDDYRIFCYSADEAERIFQRVRERASNIGLRVSEAKSAIVPSKDVAESVSSVVGHSHHELKSVTITDIVRPGKTDERTLRFALRMAAEDRNGSPLLDALATVEASRIPGSALPRLAWLLTVVPWSDISTSLVQRLTSIEDALAPWRTARLAAALWYAPTSSASGLLHTFRRQFEENIAVRPVVARAFARHRVEGLDDLLSLPGNASSKRAAALATRERYSCRPYSAKEFSYHAAASGPPVRTYL